MMERAALLHNMSSPPGAVISHTAPRARGRSIVFQLATGAAPGGLLASIDGRRWPGTAAQAEAELRRRINEHAATLPYPPAALISERAAGAAAGPHDLLTVCTILAKSSGQVYLRDKEPNMASLRKARAVVLLIPDKEAITC